MKQSFKTSSAFKISLAALGLAALLGGAAVAAGADPLAGVPEAERPAPGVPYIGGVWEMPKPIARLTTVDGKEPPLLPAAKALYDQRRAALKAGDTHIDPISNCWMQGLPRLIYAPYPVLIVQERDRINFVHEVNHTFRIVSLKKPLPADPDPDWLGYSSGRWEGGTLVIDTTGLGEQTWLDYSGLPHSEKLKVTERYTPKGPDRIEGTVTLTDPDTFSRPWTTAFTLVRKPNYQLKESVCVRDHKM